MTTYTVRTAAFCGMSILHGEFEDYASAQERLKRRANWAKNLGCNLTYHSPNEIEVGEPDDCQMIPDYCGVLRIIPVPTEHECRGCSNMVPLDHNYCEDCS